MCIRIYLVKSHGASIYYLMLKFFSRLVPKVVVIL